MIFDDIPAASTLFLDANSLLYHFVANPQYGSACTALVERIERGEIRGVTSANVLSDVAHRAMTIEAMARLGWPPAGLAARLRRHRRRWLRVKRGRHGTGSRRTHSIRAYSPISPWRAPSINSPAPCLNNSAATV